MAKSEVTWQYLDGLINGNTISETLSNPMWPIPKPENNPAIEPFRAPVGWANLGRNDAIINFSRMNRPSWGLPTTRAYTVSGSPSGYYGPYAGLGQAAPSPDGIIEKILGPNPSPFKSLAFGFVIALLICSRRR